MQGDTKRKHTEAKEALDEHAGVRGAAQDGVGASQTFADGKHQVRRRALGYGDDGAVAIQEHKQWGDRNAEGALCALV